MIGDKKGGATAAALFKNPARLDELQELVGGELSAKAYGGLQF